MFDIVLQSIDIMAKQIMEPDLKLKAGFNY